MYLPKVCCSSNFSNMVQFSIYTLHGSEKYISLNVINIFDNKSFHFLNYY